MRRDNNCHIVFSVDSVSIKGNTTGEVLLQGSIVGNVYPIHLESNHLLANVAVNESEDMWHRRLAHCGSHVLGLLKKNKVVHFETAFSDTCMTYYLAKSHKLPFSLVEHRATLPSELIHLDVWQLISYFVSSSI